MIDNLPELLNARRTGADKWQARCPAHEDKNPSLSIARRDGNWLIHCFGGCAVENVLHAVGLTWQDVLPDKAPDAGPRLPFTASDVLRALEHDILTSQVAAGMLAEGKDLTGSDRQELARASRRIGKASQYLRSVKDAETKRRAHEKHSNRKY
jgi:hypothetical protein